MKAWLLFRFADFVVNMGLVSDMFHQKCSDIIQQFLFEIHSWLIRIGAKRMVALGSPIPNDENCQTVCAWIEKILLNINKLFKLEYTTTHLDIDIIDAQRKTSGFIVVQ